MKDTRTSKTALLPPALERLLPPEVIDAVQESGAPTAEEVRLHANRFCSVRSQGVTYPTRLLLSATRIRDILHALCAGSLYAFEESICQGYLSPCRGVRVGVCGRAATEAGRVIGVCDVSTLVIRIPHFVKIDASLLCDRLLSHERTGGMLIYAPPGVGKTTLLRAIASECARPDKQRHTVVVDTREELGFGLEEESLSMCVLSAYPRRIGIEIAFRTLGAELIVCDEIGNDDEVDAILSASNCGVPLLASVHGASLSQVFSSEAMKKLHRAGVFRDYVGITRERDELRFTVTPHKMADKLFMEGGNPV